MGLLCKRYDMIALLLQAAPKVHHNLPKAIITLNSPEAIIAGDLLCGRLANVGAFYIFYFSFEEFFFSGSFTFSSVFLAKSLPPIPNAIAKATASAEREIINA